jgi:hypothetical protein
MDMKKMKEGVSVKEVEAFAKKHRFEVFFCLVFIFAALFNFVFIGRYWSILVACLGAIIGVLAPGKVEHFSKAIFHFIFKQEQTTQIVLGVVSLIVAIFLPFLIFLFIGLHAGKGMYHQAVEVYSSQNRSR